MHLSTLGRGALRSGRRSQAAKAADCKSAIPGSNPGGAFLLTSDSVWPLFFTPEQKS